MRNYFVLATTLAMLSACGGNDGSPSASASANKQAAAVNAVDATAASSASAAAAASADAADVQKEFKAAKTIPLGMKTTTPPLVIADPTLNLVSYTPPAPPAPVSTTTLSFGDFTSYLAPGSTDTWRAGASPSTITIDAPPTNGTGAGDKTVALASTYATASYEADVTVTAPVGTGAANAGFIVRTTNPSAGGPDSLTGYFIGLDTGSHSLVVGRQNNSWTNFIQYPVASVVGGSTHHLKVTTSGTAITVDLDGQRIVSVNDATNALPTVFQSGSFGLRRFGVGATFSNITIHTYPTVTSPSYDFSKVVGAVYTPSNAVNAIDFWENYDPEIVNRELTYAQTYGMNTIAVYLHYLVWANDRVAFLSKFENLLKIAARHGIKVSPIFYDDCWNANPQYGPQAAPIWGVHNSRWVQSPGTPVEQAYFQPSASNAAVTYKQNLASYITDFVAPHRNDPRIIFWETMNEPGCSGNGALQNTRAVLMNDARIAILNAGATQPINAPQVQEDEGSYFSDFYAFHPYGNPYTGPVNGSNISALNSETLQRGFPGTTGQTMPGIVANYGGTTGFIVWELMIGRTNTRFHWGQVPDAPATVEPATPFQGTIYPDGHPWQTSETQALTGGFDVKLPVLQVAYYNDPTFASAPVKTSITPLIDFDLNTERGTDSPDASAGVNATNYGVRWSGAIKATQDGTYTFSIDSDNVARLWINGVKVIDKKSATQGTASGKIWLAAKQRASIKVEYVHGTGAASMHLLWSNPSASNPGVLKIVPSDSLVTSS
ncbi:PA14 domain-containing protein [Paraburkholderia susongensis]|uniref:PA14 domain-containing protein n=1 Tax=Paraburkholderia susongensis TaxID=1515439 RepID=A0A1X7LQV1_9BURK|nr:PA14 domain-containing protein [Paraburkholderia susongensis]SMG56215.1 PA14 domain-containing protein [Paraburkholderia susongensis]